jgi:hypothetical protein
VARRVDDVDLVEVAEAQPLAERGRGRDRDAALLSCSIQSIVAAPSCTSPSLWVRPV